MWPHVSMSCGVRHWHVSVLHRCRHFVLLWWRKWLCLFMEYLSWASKYEKICLLTRIFWFNDLQGSMILDTCISISRWETYTDDNNNWNSHTSNHEDSITYSQVCIKSFLRKALILLVWPKWKFKFFFYTIEMNMHEKVYTANSENWILVNFLRQV
jgi:hypothetical protein